MNLGSLDSLYREVVLDHHRHPRGNRPLERFDVQASGKNPSCGDEVTLQMRFEGDTIADIGVLSRGCAISTSSGSILAQMLRGLDTKQAGELAEVFKAALKDDGAGADIELGELEALTGVRKFPVRVKCALLPWVTLLDALLAHREGRRPLDVTTEVEAGDEATLRVRISQPDDD